MLSEWWQATSAERRSGRTIDQAIAMGRRADRLGLAFFGGYSAALRALDPSLGPDELAALCATEAGGGHPRAIATTLRDGALEGTKQFVTGGSLATRLLVVAKTGELDGRPQLVVARVEASAPNLVIEPLPMLPFVPEVPHASVRFEKTPVVSVLAGDGYERALKPFRTIEDLHVFAAVVSCVLANGTRLPHPTIERFLAVQAALRTLASESPSNPEVHLALAGALQLAMELVDQLDLSLFDADFRERFVRDRPLLSVAQRVREQRRVKAWERA